MALDVLNDALKSLNLTNPAAFPKVDRHSKHRPQLRGSFPSNPRNSKKRKTSNENEVPCSLESLSQKPLNDCMEVQICDRNWSYMVAKANVQDIISSQSEQIQSSFWAKYREAQAYWNCFACSTHDAQLLLTGFVLCCKCERRFHKQCVKVSHDYATWTCNDCL